MTCPVCQSKVRNWKSRSHFKSKRHQKSWGLWTGVKKKMLYFKGNFWYDKCLEGWKSYEWQDGIGEKEYRMTIDQRRACGVHRKISGNERRVVKPCGKIKVLFRPIKKTFSASRKGLMR